jgi:GNAT superfamily N-acetyltransferase
MPILPTGDTIQLATAADLPWLLPIERQAAQRFLTCLDQTGLTAAILEQTKAIADFEQACRSEHLWVAVSPTRQLVGFAFVRMLDGYAHLEELDVLPDHGKRGIGRALVAAVYDWAQGAGHPGVTLRTFREVPWNAPFYQRCGFRIVDSAQLSPQHGELEKAEQRLGLRTDLRVSMVYRCD